MAKERLLLVGLPKEQAGLFSDWLKREDYQVRVANNPGEAYLLLPEEQFSLIIIDIDSPQDTEISWQLCRTLKTDKRFSDLPICSLTYKKNVTKIVTAIEAGVDRFILKPFEVKSFLERLKMVLQEIEFKKKGKKSLDLTYIYYLINIIGELDRQDFFLLSPVIINKLILGKINTILGEPIIVQIIKRVNELIGEDYAFMKEVRLSEGRIRMDGVDKASKDAKVEKIILAFRDYIYAFLHLVKTLTSDILVERNGILPRRK